MHFMTSLFFLLMESYFPSLVKNYNQISVLGSLESVANKKGVHLEKKATCKKSFN